jgi:HD-GYP domain-containing protein (c-di-GMP phosphodiesterase class II)
MAVAYFFTAWTQNRPYRKGMDSKDTRAVLQSMVDAGELDNHLVDVVFKHYAKMNDMRDSAQKEATRDYNAFQTVLHRHVK